MAAVLTPPTPVRVHGQSLNTLRAWLTRLLFVLLVVGAVLYARHYLLGDNSHPHSRVQHVKLLNLPHPPPPKAQEVKPKEPEKPKEEERPKEQETYQGQLSLIEPATPGPPGPPGLPGERPLDDQLGVEAEGEGAGDSFGLVAKRGGHDITRLGGGGGSGAPSAAQQRAIFNGYGQTVAQRLERELQGSASVLGRGYVVITLLWIDTHGRIIRCELPRSSGSADIDSALRKALADAPVLPEPPTGLPLPLKLRFTVKEITDKGEHG
ncbi:putative Periplasmic protein TonB [Burkholderiales bacterium]|nr:putative Periplasmic protein TonB [Burkholderiales bacterium]